MPKTIQVNTRVEPDIVERLDVLAQATGRTRPNLVYQAIRAFVDSETAFIEAVERGMAQAQAGQGRTLAEVNADLERIIADQRTPQ